jgi:hypothetical protein
MNRARGRRGSYLTAFLVPGGALSNRVELTGLEPASKGVGASAERVG